MGFFGVAAVGAVDHAPTIDGCHLNLWTLGGLTGYRVCCLDVGLAITAKGHTVSKMQVGIPAVTPDSPRRAIEPLAHHMRDPAIANLIFAREDALVADELLIAGRPFKILDLDRPECSMAEHPRDKHFSLWTLQLAKDLGSEESGYLRFRFHIRRPGRLWVWQRSLLARNRAIADLRVCDEREAHSVNDISGFTGHLLPLGSLDSFVIAPASFSPSTTTPEPSYVRGLEGRVWEKYLGRKTDLGRNEKFLVHRWKAKKLPVTGKSPFRGFLQLERRRSLMPSWSDLMPVILALSLAAALFNIKWRDLSWIKVGLGAASTFLFSGLPSFSGLYAVLAFVLFGIAVRQGLLNLFRSMSDVGGRIDRWVYSFGVSND